MVPGCRRSLPPKSCRGRAAPNLVVMDSSLLRRCAEVCAAVGIAAALAACNANQKIDLSKAPKAAPQQTASVPPSHELSRLHDMDAPQVEALVGSPDFRRVEPPAELWQYRTADCVVDLFFYGQSEERRVVHEDARSREPSPAGDQLCGDGSEVLSSRLRG